MGVQTKASKAKLAAKNVLKGSGKRKAKVRTSVYFHRPKTLSLARSPKYPTKAVPRAPVMNKHPHLFEIQNIVSGRVHTAHVARLRFYADSQLNVTADVKNVFQHAFNQGLFQMAGIVRVAEADDRSLIVLVDWVGFVVDERTWEPFKEIFEAAPEFLAKELRKLRVTRAIAARIKSEFGIQL